METFLICCAGLCAAAITVALMALAGHAVLALYKEWTK